VKLAIFEDELVENFYPLTHTRTVCDLRVGIYDLKHRIMRAVKVDVSEVNFYVRSYLTKLCRHRLAEEGIKARVNEEGAIDDDVVLVSGRLLLANGADSKLSKLVREEGEFLLLCRGELAAAKLSAQRATCVESKLLKLDISGLVGELKGEVKVLTDDGLPLLRYPWEIVVHNAELIKADYPSYVEGREGGGELGERVTVYGSERDVFVDEGAVVEDFVVLDAREGPIYIGRDTKVQSGARIEGPTFIGSDTIIVGGAQIREGSNIGDVCRVGGEFEESVMHGYSNKYHAGFIGHAYIGEWVNIGAMTTNSDLKDTYGTVKVTVRGERVDTGLMKVGCFMGDMVKTSIGVMIYTGKKIGVASHLHGVIYEDVPSFTIYAKSLGAEPVELYLESAIEIQRRMMRRRKKELKDYEVEVIRKVFEMTEEERRRAGVKKGRFKLP